MFKRGLKQLCYALALALVGPWALAERLARRLRGRDVWMQSHAEVLSLAPGRIGSLLRNAYYRLILRRCPFGCCLSFGTLFTHSEASLGRRVYTGAHCMVGMATIGDGTMLADHVYVLSGRHQHVGAGLATPFQDQAQVLTPIKIGANCWIGTNAVVMADIGDNCIVGAGSVVTKPVPSNSVAAGNPARVIRSTIPGAAGQPAWPRTAERAG